MKALKKIIEIIKKEILGCRMKDLIWYACYGSNMYKKRFMYYIKGGQPESSTKCYKGCSDKSIPRDNKQIMIPYELYFSKKSSSWEDKGVAFIKSERNEAVETLGRMYLVKKGQFIEIVRQESGKEPDDESINIDFETAISTGSSLVPGIEWYGRITYLGSVGNYPIFTCTAKWADEDIELNTPGEKYIKCLYLLIGFVVA
jgi:hypothetical protein